jgi:hypothetical protein
MSGAQIGREDLHDGHGGENEEDMMEGDEIQYGICWSQRAHTSEYQDSSLLSPIQIMDQEVYYNIAKDTIVLCVLVLHMMVTIFNAHHCLHAFVGRWQENIDTGIEDAVAAVHVKMHQGKK